MNKVLVNNSDLKIFKHELVLVRIPNGTTKTQFYLPDLRNLRNTKILGIEVWATQAKSPDGTDTLNANQLANMYLTLENYGGKQFLKDCPLLAFQFSGYPVGATQVETYKKTFNGQRVNYPKSYVTWFNGSPKQDYDLMMSVYYADVESEKEATFDTMR